jgi:hypothetical protein
MTTVAPPDANKIRSFWKWFGENLSLLETMVDASDVSRLSPLMDEAIASLTGTLGWEVGPGLNKDYQLAFTLKGNLTNLEIARTVISDAPKSAHWEFHAGRPPKVWDLTFTMLNRKEQQVEIDARNWQYTLVGYDSCSFFDIKIVAPNLPRMDELAKTQAATILLQGLLGEVAFLKLIDRIEIVTHDKELEDRLSDIENLPAHLTSLCASDK